MPTPSFHLNAGVDLVLGMEHLSHALADRIVALARDPELRERIGTANAELIRERQSVEATSSLVAQLLAELLGA